MTNLPNTTHFHISQINGRVAKFKRAINVLDFQTLRMLWKKTYGGMALDGDLKKAGALAFKLSLFETGLLVSELKTQVSSSN